jgi:hypothetical protein
MTAGELQGGVLGPILYLPYPGNYTLVTFADDTAILIVGKDNTETANKLQNAINKCQNWTKKSDLHRDLGMNYIDEEIQKFARCHEGRLL